MGLFVLVQAVWLFLPAYAANMAPVFAMRAWPRWNAPIDGSRMWRDGRRLLGEGKTWRGVAAGVVAGALVAWTQSLVHGTDWGLSDFGASVGGGSSAAAALGAMMGLGAIVGDAAKSFFKRRTGRPGGAPWVPFDQLDFVVGALAFAWLASAFLAATGSLSYGWFESEFLGSRWPVLVVGIVVTPALHLLVNVIGYRLRFKRVPW